MTNHHKQLSNGCNCISSGGQTLGIIQLTLNEKQILSKDSILINFKYINLYLFTLLTSDKVITAWISFSLDSFNDST